MCPTIDTKVCNKKVAVDDVGPTEVPKGDASAEQQVPVAKHEPWSCIDYVDFDHKPDERPTQGNTARKPTGEKHLSTRFGGLAGHDELREDTKGTCREVVEDRWTHRRAREFACGRRQTMEMIMPGGGSGHNAEKTERWWEEKRTNAGWPGTAEGKINTAQGMAGDLVSNLDSEEKSAVVRICGGVVCELRLLGFA